VIIKIGEKGTATVGELIDSLSRMPREWKTYVALETEGSSAESHINFIESEKDSVWIGSS
jgi:hypothetical protein